MQILIHAATVRQSHYKQSDRHTTEAAIEQVNERVSKRERYSKTIGTTHVNAFLHSVLLFFTLKRSFMTFFSHTTFVAVIKSHQLNVERLTVLFIANTIVTVKFSFYTFLFSLCELEKKAAVEK